MSFQLAVSTLVTQRSIFDIEMYGSAMPFMPSIKYVGHFIGEALLSNIYELDKVL